MSLSPSPDEQEPIPAVELPETLLPFSLVNVKQAVADASAGGDTDLDLLSSNPDWVDCLIDYITINQAIKGRID